jgi:hypothetical protein
MPTVVLWYRAGEQVEECDVLRVRPASYRRIRLAVGRRSGYGGRRWPLVIVPTREPAHASILGSTGDRSIIHMLASGADGSAVMPVAGSGKILIAGRDWLLASIHFALGDRERVANIDRPTVLGLMKKQGGLLYEQ